MRNLIVPTLAGCLFTSVTPYGGALAGNKFTSFGERAKDHYGWITALPDQVVYVQKKAYLRSPAGFVRSEQGPLRLHSMPHQRRYFTKVTKAWVQRLESINAMARNNVSVTIDVRVTVRPKVSDDYPNWRENLENLITKLGIEQVGIHSSEDNSNPIVRSKWYDFKIQTPLIAAVVYEVNQFNALDLNKNQRYLAKKILCRLRHTLARDLAGAGSSNGVRGRVFDDRTATCLPHDEHANLFDFLTLDLGKIQLDDKLITAVENTVIKHYDKLTACRDIELQQLKNDQIKLEAQQTRAVSDAISTAVTHTTLNYQRLKLLQDLPCNENTVIVMTTDINGLPVDMEVQQ